MAGAIRWGDFNVTSSLSNETQGRMLERLYRQYRRKNCLPLLDALQEPDNKPSLLPMESYCLSGLKVPWSLGLKLITPTDPRNSQESMDGIVRCYEII